MSLTRRGFFGTIAAAYVARFAPKPALPTIGDLWPDIYANTSRAGTYAGIERATFSFWRNRQESAHSTDEWMKRAEAISDSRMMSY